MTVPAPDSVTGAEEKKVHTAEIQKGEELRHSEAPTPVSGSVSTAFPIGTSSVGTVSAKAGL